MKKIFLVIVMFAIYVATSEMSAKKKAEDFCNSVSIGDSVSDLREQGIAAGARARDSNWSRVDGATQEIDVSFTGFYPGSDFICQIREKNGAVISKNHNITQSLL